MRSLKARQQVRGLGGTAEEDRRLGVVQGQHAGIGVMGPVHRRAGTAQALAQAVEVRFDPAVGQALITERAEQGAQGRLTLFGGLIEVPTGAKQLRDHHPRCAVPLHLINHLVVQQGKRHQRLEPALVFQWLDPLQQAAQIVEGRLVHGCQGYRDCTRRLNS